MSLITVIIVILAWLIMGLISNCILKNEKLPLLYRMLLLVEGLLGIFFILIFRKPQKH